MTQPTIPAFDDESPDAEILEAFEKVRVHKVWTYSFDHLAQSDPEAWARVAADVEAADKDIMKTEAQVLRKWATTPTGIAAQIILSLQDRGCSRVLDRGLYEQGIRAVYLQAKSLGLDGQETTLVTAAYELLHMEWEQALADYQRSDADFELILKIADAMPRDASEELKGLVKRAEAQFGNNEQLDRLLRTLAPDWDAYRHKAEIAIEETWAERAAPWLVRDVNFLTGVIAEEAQQAEAA